MSVCLKQEGHTQLVPIASSQEWKRDMANKASILHKMMTAITKPSKMKVFKFMVSAVMWCRMYRSMITQWHYRRHLSLKTNCVINHDLLKVTATKTDDESDWRLVASVQLLGDWLNNRLAFGVCFPLLEIVYRVISKVYPAYDRTLFDKNTIHLVAAILTHLRYAQYVKQCLPCMERVKHARLTINPMVCSPQLNDAVWGWNGLWR